MILKPKEDAKYYYDAAAAERPVKFIETYCKHSIGQHADKPFILLDWQKELVRTLFGWKHRSDNRRRFKELFILTAKGAGKTPLLAAIGLYMLLAAGEPMPWITSMASSFEQAGYTFEAGKSFINNNRALFALAEPQHLLIKKRSRKKPGKWVVKSGKPKGGSGGQPSVVLGDECHEWDGSAVEHHRIVTKNLFKRAEPISIVATNAGPSLHCYARTQYDRAKRVLDGSSSEEALLPIIFEAPISLPWDSEEAAKAANPSMGSIISFKDIAPELAKARENPSEEATYRRLYLSQWVQGSNKWLDLKQWDAVAGRFDPAELENAALYVGVDLALVDDLCAVVYVWITPENVYVKSHFWMPKVTADKYILKHAIPYDKWLENGDITLVEDEIISPKVFKEIANHIVDKHKAFKVRAVCYDRSRADDMVAELEAASLTCVPIPQGYSLTTGCAELQKRLIAGSIVIEPNAVLRFCAENVEIKTDDRGNFWPIKPNAKESYAGLRSAKVDGITALVTALVEAKKHNFPNSQKKWTGKAWLVQLP
jgi:phage terminase large subunit-like protein